MIITEEQFRSIITSAYKEGFLDADGMGVKLGYWWDTSSAKSRLDYELKRLSANV